MSQKTDKDYCVGDQPWLYIHRFPPPKGEKIHMMNITAGTSFDGVWDDAYEAHAWAPLNKRDRVQEKEVLEWIARGRPTLSSAEPVSYNQYPVQRVTIQSTPVKYLTTGRELIRKLLETLPQPPGDIEVKLLCTNQ